MTLKGQIKVIQCSTGCFLAHHKGIGVIFRPPSVRPSLAVSQKPLDKSFYNFAGSLPRSIPGNLVIFFCVLRMGVFNMGSYGDFSKLIFPKRRDNFIFTFTWCFPWIVLMTCKKVDFIESLQRSFFEVKRSPILTLALMAKFQR